MGRRKTARQADSDDATEVLENVVSSLLDLVTTDQARGDLTDSLRRLATALDLHEKPQDDWFLHIENLATLVRERCQRFLDTRRSRTDKVHTLLRKLEELSRFSAQSDSIDPVRVVLASRSFLASHRLQIQCDDHVLEEIISCLSNLYINNDFVSDKGEIDDSGMAGSVPGSNIRQWIECLVANHIMLQATFFTEALQELRTSSGFAAIERLQRISKKDAIAESEHGAHNKVLRTSVLQSPYSPLLETEDAMGAVALFLSGAADSQLTFILVVGPQGSGKTFMCDEIERRSCATIENTVQGMIEMLPPLYFASSPTHSYCAPLISQICQFSDQPCPSI